MQEALDGADASPTGTKIGTFFFREVISYTISQGAKILLHNIVAKLFA